jgi:hypothetical protein
MALIFLTITTCVILLLSNLTLGEMDSPLRWGYPRMIIGLAGVFLLFQTYAMRL